MNTIRDNIPIDHLLRQYIDETQEVDIEKKETIVKKEEVVEAPENKSTSLNSVNPVEGDEGKKMNMSQNTNMDFADKIPEHISFSNNVDTKTFESDPSERINEYDSDADSLDEPIQIGESIDLQGLESLDSDENKEYVETKLTPSLPSGFDLGVESLDEPESLPPVPPVPEPKNDIIDLGITELDM